MKDNNTWQESRALTKLDYLPYGMEILPFLYKDFPFGIEFYDRNGDCVYTNCRKEKRGRRVDPNFSYNMKSDVRVTRSEIYPVVKSAYNGATTVFRGKEDYIGIFTWYKSDTVYDITIFPVFDEAQTVRMVGMMHIPAYDSVGQEDGGNNISGESKEFITAFLSNFSHEFRTPLSWVLGYSELIDQEEDIQKIREYNKLIVKGGRLLLTLVDNLIDASAAYREHTSISYTEFDVSRLLGEICGLIENEVHQLGKGIRVHIQNSLPEGRTTIETDRGKLMQILLNLLHNAVKFTTEGEIVIGVEEENHGSLQFFVKDTGIGMDKTKLDFIFSAYSTRPAYENYDSCGNGLGLGLIVSRDFIERLGGRIWVNSQPGAGSTFHFTIKYRHVLPIV